jgi:hypothetical protein
MHTRSTFRRACAFVAGIVMLAAAAALLAPSSAMASACGDRVLDDWWDNGRIDRQYPIQCYHDAIDSIPDDLRDYANVEEVISRALQAAISGEGGGPSDPDEPSTDGSPTRPADGSPGGNDDPGEVLDGVDASSPSSIPIPLLLLAAMSILLLGAGGLGYLSRRRNGEALGEVVDVPPDDEPRL